jgi:hypothetical protein
MKPIIRTRVHVKITVAISDYIGRITKTDNGIEVENIKFCGVGEWWGTWFCFRPIENQYYTRYANHEVMIFGEYKGEIIGNPIWEYQFKRST